MRREAAGVAARKRHGLGSCPAPRDTRACCPTATGSARSCLQPERSRRPARFLDVERGLGGPRTAIPCPACAGHAGRSRLDSRPPMMTLPVRRRCRQCGNTFRPIRRYDQVFCRPECRRRWHSWREGRGARAVELLIQWRRDRRRGSLTKLAVFADDLVREHREHEAERQHAGRAERRECA
jgi:hypothetical protein